MAEIYDGLYQIVHKKTGMCAAVPTDNSPEELHIAVPGLTKGLVVSSTSRVHPCGLLNQIKFRVKREVPGIYTIKNECSRIIDPFNLKY